jgi:hypothetical protein
MEGVSGRRGEGEEMIDCSEKTKLHYVMKVYRCKSEHSTIKTEYTTLTTTMTGYLLSRPKKKCLTSICLDLDQIFK